MPPEPLTHDILHDSGRSTLAKISVDDPRDGAYHHGNSQPGQHIAIVADI